MSLEILTISLVNLTCCLKHGDHARPIIVILPTDSWMALYYEVSHKRIALSEQSGCGGILTDYPPPDGESYGTGFWHQGVWVKHAPKTQNP